MGGINIYSFYHFFGYTGLWALSFISYDYFKLLLGKKLENRLLLLFLSGAFTYFLFASVHYLLFKNIIHYIEVIPAVLISFDLFYERKQIFSSNKNEHKKIMSESPLEGIKYKVQDGFKTVHPLLAAFIFMAIAYFFHVLFFMLGNLVQ